jgi:hypothetical protein
MNKYQIMEIVKIKCQNCDWVGDTEDLTGIMWEGDKGQCPNCYSGMWTSINEDYLRDLEYGKQ